MVHGIPMISSFPPLPCLLGPPMELMCYHYHTTAKYCNTCYWDMYIRLLCCGVALQLNNHINFVDVTTLTIMVPYTGDPKKILAVFLALPGHSPFSQTSCIVNHKISSVHSALPFYRCSLTLQPAFNHNLIVWYVGNLLINMDKGHKGEITGERSWEHCSCYGG